MRCYGSNKMSSFPSRPHAKCTSTRTKTSGVRSSLLRELPVYRANTSSAVSASSLYLSRFQKTHPDLLAKPSVNIIAPTYIDTTATIDPTAKIGPNVAIGPGVKVAAGVRVKDAIIFEGTSLDQHSCVLNSIVGQNCHIGPWARVDGIAEPEDNKGKISVTVLGESSIDRGLLSYRGHPGA